MLEVRLMGLMLTRLLHRTQHKQAHMDSRSQGVRNVLLGSTSGCYGVGTAVSRKHVCIIHLDVEHTDVFFFMFILLGIH